MKQLTRYFLILVFGTLIFVGCGDENDPDSPPNDNGKIVANDFLSESRYKQLVVEIAYVEGYKPQTASLNHLKSFLESRLNKSGGISINSVPVASPGKATYSLTDIRNIEETHRTKFPSGETLAAWLFFYDGDYAANQGDSKVLGVAYGATSMAVFGKTVAEFSGGLGQPSTYVLETTVMEHEFCHIFGLVNNGTNMVSGHQDATHGKHCSDKNCLMYYAAETSDFLSNFLGSNIPSLDEQCLHDLKNNGGK